MAVLRHTAEASGLDEWARVPDVPINPSTSVKRRRESRRQWHVPAGRKAVSVRMTRYWAERRKAQTKVK